VRQVSIKSPNARRVCVFVLQHVHHLSDGSDETKLIGVYSNEQKGMKAIALLGTCQRLWDSRSQGLV
jgi:hypothetical protein